MDAFTIFCRSDVLDTPCILFSDFRTLAGAQSLGAGLPALQSAVPCSGWERCHSLALYFVFYNFLRPHSSLGGKTPAEAAGLA